MSHLARLMGKEVFDLIFTHYDSDGKKIEDPEDVLYCDETEIDHSRIKPLTKLLLPASTKEELIVSIEAAKLLASWGVEEAVDYFEYCIENRIDKLGNLYPDRLHSYNVIYEHITDALLHYQARCSDRSSLDGDLALEKVKPLILDILELSRILPYNMTWILPTLKRKKWKLFASELELCFTSSLSKEKKSHCDHQNIIELKLLFQNWDPIFLSDIEKKFGVISNSTKKE